MRTPVKIKSTGDWEKTKVDHFSRHLQEKAGLGKVLGARSYKTWLMYLFLALGLVCSIILPLTIMTYLDYAQTGYGMEAEVQGFSQGVNNNILVKTKMTNPNKLLLRVTKAELRTSGSQEWTEGNVPGEILDIDRESSEEVVFTFPDAGNVGDLASGSLDFQLAIEIYIPQRDAYTTLVISGAEVAG